jgi:DNA-binding PadR family transcriptional regulator
MHGYDLYRLYQTRLGHVWKMSQSQMYSTLKRLESKGLVRRLADADQGEALRRYLEVTPEGAARFSDWLMHPTDYSSRTLRLEFVARLYFAKARGDGTLGKIIRDQAAALNRHLANHERLLRELAPDDSFNRLSVDFRIRQLRTASEWMRDAVLPLLDSGEETVSP